MLKRFKLIKYCEQNYEIIYKIFFIYVPNILPRKMINLIFLFWMSNLRILEFFVIFTNLKYHILCIYITSIPPSFAFSPLLIVFALLPVVPWLLWDSPLWMVWNRREGLPTKTYPNCVSTWSPFFFPNLIFYLH